MNELKRQVLQTAVPGRNFDLALAVRKAAQARAISPLRVLFDVAKLARGRQRLSWQDHFLFGAHQARLTDDERAEFLGEGVLQAMNRTLTPKPAGLSGLFTDKLLTDLVLTRNDLPVAPVRAVFVRGEALSPYVMLRDRVALERFLAETPPPFFGKPGHGSRSVGAVSVVARTGARLHLGDGTEVAISDFSADVERLFPEGYLFQDLMQPHPHLARIIGPVIGSVRVVTLRYGGEVTALYSAMKMPGKGQMVDDIMSYINTMCGIDHQTGRIVRGQDACRLGGTEMALNPVTGTVLGGVEMPMWPEVMRVARAVHAAFPRQGVLGSDFAITASGPRVIEVNSRPMHGFYQKCFARGFWNADIAPHMTEALAAFGHTRPTRQLPFP